MDFVNAQTYDTAGRVSRITQADGSPSAGATVKNKRVDFTWDNANRLVSMSRFDSLDTSAAVAVTQNTYDTAGRTSSIQHQTGSTALAGYTFAWDAASRLTSVSSVRDGLTNYSHDATNQLTAADHTGQTDEVLSYDANGNRTSANGQSGFVTGTSNRTLTDGTYNYTYDLEGNRTSRTEIATGIKVEYSWNHANQLTKVTWRNAANAVTKTVEYRYDGLGRRIEKSVDDNGNGTVDRREQYIYEGAGLLTASGGSVSISGPNGELNQHGWVDDVVLVLDGAGTIQHRYLHGPLIDQVFADETAGGEVLWALADHLGTVRDWARRADFDSNGTQETQVVNHVKFSAFGDVVSQTAGTTPPLHSYTGQLWDADADLMYYRARWYDPTLGRFVSEDPMGFEAGDANLSRYVGNSAVDRTDPSGLDAVVVSDGSHAWILFEYELSRLMTPHKPALVGPYPVLIRLEMFGPGWEKTNVNDVVKGIEGEIGVTVYPRYGTKAVQLPKYSTESTSVRHLADTPGAADRLIEWVDARTVGNLAISMRQSFEKEKGVILEGKGIFSTYQVPAIASMSSHCTTFAAHATTIYSDKHWVELFPNRYGTLHPDDLMLKPGIVPGVVFTENVKLPTRPIDP